MFFAAEHPLPDPVHCLNLTQPPDCRDIFLWVYARQEGRDVDRVFQWALAGYFLRRRHWLLCHDIKLPLALIAASDFSYSMLVYLFLFFLRGKLQFVYYLLHIMLPELVYTILVTVILYFIILKINQKLEKIEKRSATKFV